MSTPTYRPIQVYTVEAQATIIRDGGKSIWLGVASSLTLDETRELARVLNLAANDAEEAEKEN